jgi:hypothetical protein
MDLIPKEKEEMYEIDNKILFLEEKMYTPEPNYDINDKIDDIVDKIDNIDEKIDNIENALPVIMAHFNLD